MPQLSPKQLTSLLLTSVIATGGAVPTVDGYYQFAGLPAGGLPVVGAGPALAVGDIARRAAGVWEQYIPVANAPSSVMVGATMAVAVPYNLSNGSYAAAPLATANYFTKLLNNVAAGSRIGPTAVTEWSASYTARGGTVIITADFTAYISTANALHSVSLLRDGIAIDTRTFFVNAAAQHAAVPTLRAVLPNETGAHTYSISLTTAMTVDSGDRCTMLVEEFGASAAVTGQVVDFVNVSQTAATTGTNLTTVTSTGTSTFGTLLAVAGRVALTGATVVGSLPANTTTTHNIAIAKNGPHKVDAILNIQSAGANGQWGQLVKNGTTVLAATAAYSQAASAGMSVTFSWSGNLAAGDTLDFRLSASSAGTIGVIGYSLNVNQLGSSATTQMVGATAAAAGAAGFVPAPAVGQQTSVLRGDGTWGTDSGYALPYWSSITPPTGYTYLASSEFGAFNAGWMAFKAINLAGTGGATEWATAAAAAATLRVGLPYAQVINTVALRGRSSGEIPLTWAIEGSQDGTTWTRLYASVRPLYYVDGVQTFEFVNTTAYLFYRFNMLTSSGGNPGLNVCHFSYSQNVATNTQIGREVSLAKPNVGVFNGSSELGNVEGFAVTETVGAGGTTSKLLTVATAQRYSGESSFRIGTGAAADGSAYGSAPIKVVPGRTYRVRIAYLSDFVWTQGLYIRALGRTNFPPGGAITLANRTNSTELITANSPIATANVWNLVDTTFTAPANTYWVSLGVYHWANAPATASLWFDVLEFSEAIALPVVQRFTAPGTYTPTAGMKYCEVEILGGGGGGGGASAGSVGVVTLGAPGSAGGYIKILATAAQIGASKPVVVGAAGAAGTTSGAAGAGTLSRMTGIGQANGGAGGAFGATAGNFPIYARSPTAGGTTVLTIGQTLVAINGDPGTPSFGGISGTGVALAPGVGGNSPHGTGGVSPAAFTNVAAPNNIAGVAGTGNGSGGSPGASAGTGSVAQVGGAGTAGLIIVTEYFA